MLRRRSIAVAIGATVALFGSALAGVSAATPDPFGLTTVEQRIVPAGAPGFDQLAVGAGEPYLVREEGFGAARADRGAKRASLAYFGQLSDFQLADEESPSRVEVIDPFGAPFEAAYRPWEALEPFVDDAAIRQINSFGSAAPVPAGDGSRRAMDFAIDTGDSADSQQLNEVRWVRTLLEGGALDPNSGIDPTAYTHATCPPVGVPGAEEAARYTGVQDYDDYVEGPSPYFYDPDDPRGSAAGWPSYPGLMDRAQQPFTAAGLAVPSYVAFGNHDALVQGNQAANTAFEQVATGCAKTMEGVVGLVPPDPARRYVSKTEFKQILSQGGQADGHGFAAVDPGENSASKGSTGYYSFVPVRGLRMIALDTVSEGGLAGVSAEGNVDDPQFRWLEAELKAATKQDQLVVLFSHHAIPSLNADLPDESAGACTVPDEHGHDVNPGCDADPRDSSPIHLGPDLVALLHEYPHVIAWVAGHSHVNDVTPYPDPEGRGHGFWGIRAAAEADWPQQSRLLQLFDNRDDTLSIFATILDHASPVTAPPPGTPVASMSPADLASLGRTLSYNDAQTGARACGVERCGEGGAEDRNVELLVNDPRSKKKPRLICKSGRRRGGKCVKRRCGGNRVAGTRRG
jgi:3',5'-cyclic AMP phosphodiesterase CpdA